ncbi:MAG: nucleotidyltransferase domain-containing protein [Promethearchaeota archaeon]|jgi:predicted nucleotidyltransferase
MEYIKGIEGDYIETKKTSLIFDVKGLLHPHDRKICFLRFYPHPEGDRVRKGVKFKKVYNLDERYSLIKNFFPKYSFYSKELDIKIQGVYNNDIKKIYTPRDCLQNLIEKDDLSNVEKRSKNFCELCIKKGDLSKDSIGITGSIMVGLNKEDSDIDIIIYGTETSLKFQEKLIDMFGESNQFRRYNLDEYKSHYNWRVGGSDISFKEFMRTEQRKLHQGMFHEQEFFIRYIKSPEEWNGNFYDYQYKNYGRIKAKVLVTDSTDSIFTPCSYKIKALKVLDKESNLKKINHKNILEINSFRARFCEHAMEGETVIVEGKLEKVVFKNELEYFRILLTDQTKDKMLIVN